MAALMKLDACSMAFLSDGGLLAATDTSLVRIDVDRMKPVAKRKASLPAFAVSPQGALFVAEKNSVVACDPVTRIAHPRTTDSRDVMVDADRINSCRASASGMR